MNVTYNPKPLSSRVLARACSAGLSRLNCIVNFLFCSRSSPVDLLRRQTRSSEVRAFRTKCKALGSRSAPVLNIFGQDCLCLGVYVCLGSSIPIHTAPRELFSIRECRLTAADTASKTMVSRILRRVGVLSR
jgi:hypothetical protein